MWEKLNKANSDLRSAKMTVSGNKNYIAKGQEAVNVDAIDTT